MAYPSFLSEEKLALIKDDLETISALEEGQSYSLTSQDITRIRTILYEWRHINSLKDKFKIIQESPTQLTILRRNTPPPAPIENRYESEEAIQYVHTHLIEVLQEKEALRLIIENLPPEQISPAYQEWRRING